MRERDPDASPPPGVSVANRNVIARGRQNHKLGLQLRRPEVSFSQANVPAASVQAQGSANFLVSPATWGCVWTAGGILVYAPWRAWEEL